MASSEYSWNYGKEVLELLFPDILREVMEIVDASAAWLDDCPDSRNLEISVYNALVSRGWEERGRPIFEKFPESKRVIWKERVIVGIECSQVIAAFRHLRRITMLFKTWDIDVGIVVTLGKEGFKRLHGEDEAFCLEKASLFNLDVYINNNIGNIVDVPVLGLGIG